MASKNKIGLIIRHEYLMRVRKKSFWLVGLLTPIALVAVGVLIAFLAAVNESESVAALKKNAVRAPGVEKMDTLALRRDRDILVLRGNGRIFCRLDDLYCRWLEFVFLSEFFDKFGKILYCHILQPFREFILSCAARQRTASKAEHIRPA